MTMAAKDMQMIADRWMMESRRLVNWGSYEGYHEFRPSTDGRLPVTLLAGASESGKSTLVDAQISLLYPTGTPFNKASNSGRSERSDYTYLRGMVGVGNTDEGDRPIYLRGLDDNGAPQAVWGAIVDTYRNTTTGQVLSCGKFLYLMPGDKGSEVRRQYVAWDRPIDPRAMDRFRESAFTPSQLKTAYPECLTFPSAEAFHTHIWSVMGLSADACRLLHKIQSADAPSRLDDIFKQGVLGVPEALDLARSTVEDYERYDENFRTMEQKARRMDALQGIQRAHGGYATAVGAARAFDPVDPAGETGRDTLRAWAIARMAGEVAAQLPLDEQERDARMAASRAAGARSEELRGRIDAIRAQMQGLDGGNLARLEFELDQSRRTLAAVRDNRAHTAELFDAVGETMPASEQAWDQRRVEAVNFKRVYDQRAAELETERSAADRAHYAALDTLQRLRHDYERQKTQRTRISRQMDETRAMLCRATGLDAGELPYVAELMDVREDEEAWRLAMNVAYGPIAQTILVDKRHEQGFAAKVSTIDPHQMARRTWQFVDTTRDYGAAAALEDAPDARPADRAAAPEDAWLSSKLRYRDESPFAGWLREQTRSERLDARCVAAIDDADRDTRQVQADGQIKSGKRGQHGVKDRQQVIGYVNESYLHDLERQIDQASDTANGTERTLTAAKRQVDALRRGLTLADQLAYTAWDRIDADGAAAAVTELETTIASIKNDPELAKLAALKDSLSEELDRSERDRIQDEQAADAAADAADAARAWLNSHQTGAAGTSAGADGTEAGPAPSDAAAAPLDDEVASALAESYDGKLPGDDPALRAHMIIGAGQAASSGNQFAERVIAGIGKDMASRVDALSERVAVARAGVETRMDSYLHDYAADDDAVTASVEDYRYYLEELESLSRLTAVAATDGEYRRCLDQLLMSLLTIKRAIDTDASDIRSQLDRINAMLEGQQFGPKHGSLSLHADVRRPERAFSAQLSRAIGTLNDWKSEPTAQGAADSRRAFAACAPMIDLLRDQLAQVKDANGVKSYGARDLDPRCRSSFYAIVHHEDGPDERITSTGGRSGGALQELTSFVYGAALIYLLGGGMTSEPSYTTLFLDEALIKADGRYTQRALTVLPRLGFQVIVSAPESKTGEILEVSTKAYVTYKDPDTGLTSLREAVLRPEEGAQAPAGAADAAEDRDRP